MAYAENTPNPPEIRPRAVFERMFGAADDEKDPAKRQRHAELSEEHSRPRARATRSSLKSTLGGADRRKLDEYLFAIRDIEKRIQKTEREQRARGAPVGRAVRQHPDRVRRALAA